MATTSRRRLPALLGRRGATRTNPVPIVGTARLGARTKHLVKRLHPGDIAVIDHVNVDRIAAEELIASGVSAVVNASPSSDGKYPNAGPLMLARAGIRLVDAPEVPVFDLLRDAASEGMAIVLFSTEPEQFANVCSRVVILRGGSVAAELTGAELNPQSISQWCYS